MNSLADYYIVTLDRKDSFKEVAVVAARTLVRPYHHLNL